MKKILVLACFVLVFLSCNSCDDDSCAPVTLSITSLEEEYSCVNTPYQMDIDVSDEFIIIRSQADFDALVTGSCMPQIDFITYDLLIGKKALTNGVESINYDGLVKDCENGQLSLTVTFVKNDTDEAPNLTYHALVPKLELDDIINVSIVTLN
ncbi:hypothetical protein [Psychroserpens algicola]|uniref:Lipocalin-like domain-containing protein n=1 Tax=Psychroserpens algicola TaxID=1719034 RepID=A0ABT0H5Q0_9FLAO|nr:hypothetical protein [Psychroserpens algicola]MCK8479705.1 hypothetical protein [Psychroserpens algicola]